MSDLRIQVSRVAPKIVLLLLRFQQAKAMSTLSDEAVLSVLGCVTPPLVITAIPSVMYSGVIDGTCYIYFDVDDDDAIQSTSLLLIIPVVFVVTPILIMLPVVFAVTPMLIMIMPAVFVALQC